MIKLKNIIKEGVIEPLLEAETYNLKSKKTGKIVTFTNKDNYKDALKGGDYEEPDTKGGEEKGKEDPGKLSGSDFDRQADKPKEKPDSGGGSYDKLMDKIPDYQESQKMSPNELEKLAKEIKKEHGEIDKEVSKSVEIVNNIKPRPMALNSGGKTLSLLPREQQPDKEAYDKYVEASKKAEELIKKRENLTRNEKRVMDMKDDVIKLEKQKKAVDNLEKKESTTDIVNRFLDQDADVFYLKDGDDEHEVKFSDLSDGLQQKIKDEINQKLDKIGDALKAYDDAEQENPNSDNSKLRQAFYDAEKESGAIGGGSALMSLGKDLGIDLSDKEDIPFNEY